MKKILFFLIWLAVSATLPAQDIAGRWVASHNDMSERETKINLSILWDITDDGRFNESLTMDIYSEQNDFKLKMMVSCKGTYTRGDGVIAFLYDAKAITSEILENPKDFGSPAKFRV